MTPDHDHTLAAGAANTSQRLVPPDAGKAPLALRLAVFAAALVPATFPVVDPGACRAAGGTYEITFSGQFFAGDGTPFGVTIPAPFSFSIVYNTALDTDPTFLPAGTNVGGGVILQHPFHAYSPSGIVATNLTFGTQTWTAAHIRTLPFTQGGAWGTTPHYIWFDTDITVAAPTRCFIDFSAFPGGNLTIGGYHTGLGRLTDSCDVQDFQGQDPAFATGFGFDITVTEVVNPYSRVASTIDSGGSTLTSTDNLYTIRATIGQHDAAKPTTGTSPTGNYILRPGYWENIPPPPCPGDLNGDRLRNVADLTYFLASFSATVPPALPAADLNGDNLVNTADLVIFLSSFGVPCPP